ncbi:CinA family protein [Algirhabdus cladophorae]|uniref:CinA family protein n=1 Tax=Algirhabdus cladophorae TaxID=3377108 RepID=UPI003B846114
MSAQDLLASAKAKGIMIATAESCTAGMISAALTDLAGSSAIFDRGFVTYTNAAKKDLLGVTSASLEAHGAVSEAVAGEMANGALTRSQSDMAVAVTGIAGPGGSDHKPEGRVCFGLAQKTAGTVTQTVDFGALGRAEVRAATVAHALKMLQSAIDTL